MMKPLDEMKLLRKRSSLRSIDTQPADLQVHFMLMLSALHRWCPMACRCITAARRKLVAKNLLGDDPTLRLCQLHSIVSAERMYLKGNHLIRLSLRRVYTLSHRKRIVPFPSVETARPASTSSLSRFVHHSLFARRKIIYQNTIFLIGHHEGKTA